MSHLSDEEFEDILQGIISQPEHLNNCKDCSGKLSEKQALGERLRLAFKEVESDEKLVEAIRKSIKGQKDAAPRRVRIGLHWRGWVTAAAAALIIIVPMIFYLVTPTPATAAQAALVKIHEHNISGNHEFYSEADPAKLAAYFKNKLGFSPYMPEVAHGLALRGCCVRHFREQIVGSYVVDTPEGVMSIIVVMDKPETLGMGEKIEMGGHTIWKSSFAKCKMATIRLGDYSYCAVGEISHSYLIDLLSKLLHEQEL